MSATNTRYNIRAYKTIDPDIEIEKENLVRSLLLQTENRET